MRVSRSLDLLAKLKQTVSDFAKKEDQLTRELQTRRYQADRKHRDALHRIDGELAVKSTAADAFCKEETARLRAIYERRLARAQRSHGTLVRTLPRRAQEAKGNFLGSLQMRERRAERALASGMAASDAHFADSVARLGEQRAVLAQIEDSARRAFGGYGSFRKLLAVRAEPGSHSEDPAALLHDLQTHLSAADESLREFQRAPIPRIFSHVPFGAFVAVILFVGIALAFRDGIHSPSYFSAGIATALLLAGAIFLHRFGFTNSRPAAVAAVGAVQRSRAAHDACGAASEARRVMDRQGAQEQFDRTGAEIQEHWKGADSVEGDFEKRGSKKLEAQMSRIAATIERNLKPKVTRLDAERAKRVEALTGIADAEKRKLGELHDTEIAALRANETERWDVLQSEWKVAITPVCSAIDEMNSATASRFPEWTRQLAETWTPPADFTPATRFGRLEVDLTKRAEGVPALAKLALPASSQVSIPLSLAYPSEGSLLFESNESGGAVVTGPLNNIILRLLSTTPPGKLSFTIIDAVGLGQNFAGLMHIADYEESLINRRIWTQRDQIDERLGELNEHIEKVIQMYLRNEYATITEYNEKAGSVAEKYHFLVVADFPAGFSETAAKRLQSIAISGPRCGVFTLIHWDQRLPMPDGFSADELRKASICIRRVGNDFALGKEQIDAGAALVFDPPPEPELALSLVHKIGKSSVDSNRVQVPFEQIAPRPAEFWTNDTTNELRIAVGRTGATKLQYLAIGKGTRQHGLFAGKTGSGKSTLFHVIITNLALACSPDQVEFYLIDFKKGVEFKCYATKRLPHARVVAIESDREFALSVLQRVDEELKRRGDIFRKLGCQDLAGYKRSGATEPMPRSLLLIDEFQEFFVEDDAIAQTASLLFDRIVRQGRAFGIHVLLGSQSLGGAYSLARATLGQMVIRVALQCNEADAYLIMDDSNSAPRLLSRPGEGIYNDAGGAIEGNSPFQVVWLPDDERDAWLDKVQVLTKQFHDPHRGPIVFEGNAPADIRENDLLRFALDTPPAAPPASARCWLGAPNSIKGPTEAVFQRQSGNHLLIVGQRDEAALGILGLSLLTLAAQYPIGAVRFIFLHGAAPGTPDADFIEQIVAAIPHKVEVPKMHEIPEVMNDLAAVMKARTSGELPAGESPAIFLFVHGLHKFKKLRQEDEFSFSSSDSAANPGAQFNDLICEGSTVGIHIITAVDTFNNVNRSMSRKALSEFEMRVVFQMSANDSASLIESPKASNLGLHRALFYNEQAGTLETFRPYATPDGEWLRHAGVQLSRRLG